MSHAEYATCSTTLNPGIGLICCGIKDTADRGAIPASTVIDPAKGLILIAGDITQLEPWLAGISSAQREQLSSSWPGPFTWLVPDNGRAHPLLRGEHVSLAVRVSDHPLVQALCAEFGGPVRTVARSMMSEPELVSEVVQQTFIKAWKASGSFDPQRELAPWLYSIARRTAIDVLRRERRLLPGS